MPERPTGSGDHHRRADVRCAQGTLTRNGVREFYGLQRSHAAVRRIDELRILLETQRKLLFVTPFVFHRDGKQIKAYDGAWKTACKRAGAPEAAASRMTGHKTRCVFERYNIVSGDDLREAALKKSNVAMQDRRV